MKSLIRSVVIHTIVIWFIAEYVGGISYMGDFKYLLGASFALSLVDALVKPLINLLLLPFNIVTLGAFRWISSVFALYLTTLFVPKFSISAFVYPGLATSYFIIPSITFSVLGAYIVVAILISFLISFIFWVIR